MKHTFSEMRCCQSSKITVPNIIHFIWIGNTNEANLKYIDIWRRTNKEKVIYFWHDESFSLCADFHKAIHEYVLSQDNEDKISFEINLKNKAFDYIFPKVTQGYSFDELVLKFLSANYIPFCKKSKNKLNSWFAVNDIIVKNIDDVFNHDFFDFKKYYCYEIILRGNIASASDIVRLLIIYIYGGIYMDVDTLPQTNYIFKETNKFIIKEKIIEDDFMLLFKTMCILNRLSHIDLEKHQYFMHYRESVGKEKEEYNTILSLIEHDIADFSVKDISPLGEIYVHKNLLSVGSIKRLKGIYFNNFIASHKNAKILRIILRNMNKRYRFLEKNECIFQMYKDDKSKEYLTRLLTWRTELFTRNYSVTTALTGPGLIVETMLGLAYELLNVNKLTDPRYIAEYMQNDTFGIAFFKYNIDTPDGAKSTWQK